MKKLLIGLLALSSLSTFAQQKPYTVDSELQAEKLVVRVSYKQAFRDLSGVLPMVINPYKHNWTKNIQCSELDDGTMMAKINVTVDVNHMQVHSIRENYKKLKFDLNDLCEEQEVSSVVLNGKEVLHNL